MTKIDDFLANKFTETVTTLMREFVQVVREQHAEEVLEKFSEVWDAAVPSFHKAVPEEELVRKPGRKRRGPDAGVRRALTERRKAQEAADVKEAVEIVTLLTDNEKLLRRLNDEGEQTSVELSTFLHASRHATRGRLQRLVRKGLVKVSSHREVNGRRQPVYARA